MKKAFILFTVALSLFIASCDNAPTQGTGETPAAGATEPAAAPADAASLLQGKWQSAEDPKSTFEIAGTSLVQYYDGQNLGARKFEFSADCGGNACAGGAGNKGCYTSAGEMDIECYSIVSISETALETSMVGATGNTLKYNKVK